MIITSTIIRSFAASYTLPELREKLTHAQEELTKGSTITSVTSGAGTGYSRTITLPPAEAVELFQRAIDYKTGRPAGDDATQVERFEERSVC